MTRNLFIAFFSLIFLFSIYPQKAMAFDNCIPQKGSGQYTEAVVKCVKEPLRVATINVMKKISDIFKPVALALSTIAIVFFAISILDAGGSVSPLAFKFVLRLGLVSFFGYNLGGFAEKIIGTPDHDGILDQLLKIVTASDYSPWQQIDAFIGELLGFAKDGNHKELKDGIIGLISGSFTVKVEGAMLTGVGLLTLWAVMGFMFEAVFLYLSSIMVIGFLIIISPIIIPFAIFNYGEQYLKQWINTLISAMLAPVIAFAIMWIFIGNGTTSNEGIFKSMVDDVFKVMDDNGVPSKDYMENNSYTNQSFLSLLQNVDAEQQKTFAAKQCLDDKGHKIAGCKPQANVPAVQPAVNPSGSGASSSILEKTEVDFGEKDIAVKKALFIALLQLFVFSYIMKVMMQGVQSVVSSLAGTFKYTGGGSSPLAEIITNKIG